ncbi:MAG: ATP-binding cassette domain-containing protein [Actinomycetota bacterium]|nr:ATP-binding cassette domain-containing protein [Actinomycetota bacterium]
MSMTHAASPDAPTAEAQGAAHAIEAVGLEKVFGTGAGAVRALDGLDVVARAGEVTAVLGPNGAGKSTLVRAVATLGDLDGGRLTVGGIDALRHPERVRPLIGLAGQSAAVEPALTGRENLVMVARLFGHDRRAAARAADAVLAQLGLTDAADRLVRGYSGGMRRRLDLGASLVGRPRLLLLDEPTTGLDPRSRRELWDAIRALVRAGTDVLLTTQYLEEADELADRITIIDAGRAIASGTPAELKSLAGRDVVEVRARDAAGVEAVRGVLAALGDEEPRVEEATRTIAVAVDDGTTRLAEAVRTLADRQVDVDDIGLRRPTLDEVFLALTGRDDVAEAA